jgi:S-adenosyl methyltransferase
VPDFDTSIPHSARVYDYWLGGKDNFAADREVGDRTIQAYPNVVHSVRANRRFLARAVRYLARDEGIRQFLDIGTGIPSADNTHEVAQRIAPASRIVYVDNDRCKSGCVHALQGWSVLEGAGTSCPVTRPFAI